MCSSDLSIDIPLHTVMELTPKADGTMAETRFIVDVDKAIADAQSGLLHAGGEFGGAGQRLRSAVGRAEGWATEVFVCVWSSAVRPGLPACPLPPPRRTALPVPLAGSDTSSLSSSPDKSAVHFDLSGGGAGGSAEGPRPMFKRSLSMAELAAADLVRQEERGDVLEEPTGIPSLAAMAAAAAAQEEQAQQQQVQELQRTGSR